MRDRAQAQQRQLDDTSLIGESQPIVFMLVMSQLIGGLTLKNVRMLGQVILRQSQSSPVVFAVVYTSLSTVKLCIINNSSFSRHVTSFTDS